MWFLRIIVDESDTINFSSNSAYPYYFNLDNIYFLIKVKEALYKNTTYFWNISCMSIESYH